MDEAIPHLPTVINCLDEALAGKTTMVPIETEVTPTLAGHLKVWLCSALADPLMRKEVAYMNRLPRPLVETPDAFVGHIPQEGYLEIVHQVLAFTHRRKQVQEPFAGNMPELERDLSRLLGFWNFHLIPIDGGLAYRVDPQVEQAARIAVMTADHAGLPNASEHLRECWRLAYSMHPEPGQSVHEAIKAVEAAMLPVLTPNDGRAIYTKALGQLKVDRIKWQLTIITDRGDDSVEPLIQMLDRLGMAEVDRHEGAESKGTTTLDSARACAHLAATLVQWFCSGAVRRR